MFNKVIEQAQNTSAQVVEAIDNLRTSVMCLFAVVLAVFSVLLLR